MRLSAIIAVKAVHSAIFVGLMWSVLVLLYEGVRARSDRTAAIAGTLVVGEALVFYANGRRCPLTAVAEDLGAESGAVTFMFLPGWLAQHVFEFTFPIVLISLALHARNLLEQRAQSAAGPRSGANSRPFREPDPRRKRLTAS
jgi:hypothetical protein